MCVAPQICGSVSEISSTRGYRKIASGDDETVGCREYYRASRVKGEVSEREGEGRYRNRGRMSALNAAIRHGRSRNCFRFSINSRTRARARAHAADSSFREPVFGTPYSEFSRTSRWGIIHCPIQRRYRWFIVRPIRKKTNGTYLIFHWNWNKISR
jgi:hypothetical protein